MKDNRNNVVAVTQFESLLSHYVLTHQHHYEALYQKIFDALDAFIKRNRSDREGDRAVFGVFSTVNLFYPGYDSIEALKTSFSLPAAECFIKHCCDSLLRFRPTDVIERPRAPSSLAGMAYATLYGKNAVAAQKTLTSAIRIPTHFSGSNRGVLEVETPSSRESSEDSDWDLETHDLGITEAQYTPAPLKNFFSDAISRVRSQYETHEDSPFVRRLRQYHLPVIAGASGSTEMLFSKLLPLVDLSPDEVRLLLFVQSMNMVAHGYHSYFECMFTAENIGFKVEDQDDLRSLYLQTFPSKVLDDPEFMALFESETMQALIRDLHPEGKASRPTMG